MKKILTLLFLTTFCISAFSQKKPKPKPPEVLTVETSKITINDKLIGDFKIKNKKYNIYCGYQNPNSFLQQENGDTLQVYKIVADKSKYSEMEITKYATRKGKIIRESFYKIEKDTLIVTAEYFDYSGAFRLTDKYITDKYGLKKVSDEIKSIDTENLSDKYIKPAKMNLPPPIKN